jgi:hypothetical protein
MTEGVCVNAQNSHFFFYYYFYLPRKKLITASCQWEQNSPFLSRAYQNACELLRILKVNARASLSPIIICTLVITILVYFLFFNINFNRFFYLFSLNIFFFIIFIFVFLNHRSTTVKSKLHIERRF